MTMKQKLFFLSISIVLFASLLLTACSKEYESPLQGKQLGDMTFDASQSFRDIGFDGQDLSNLTVHSSATWCVPGVFESKLRVAVLDNQTYEERRATVEVTDIEDKTHTTFSVIQQQNDAIIASPVTYDAPEEGGNVIVTLQKNVENCKVQPQVDWITASTRSLTRGLTDATIELSVAKNESEAVRDGQVMIKSADSDAYCIVTIHQPFTYKITLESEILQVGASGGELEFTVYANFDYRAEIQPTYNWIQNGTRTKLEPGKYSHKLNISALPSDMDSRRGLVYFDNSDLSYYRLLTIEQRRE